jgi:hypothetical protein
MERHLDACYGSGPRRVLHELVSPIVHVDIHVVPPSREFPHFRLVTCGMSELPMNVHDRFTWSPYAELTIALPADWPISRRKLRDQRVRWPFQLLRELARLPHRHKAYLWDGHSAPWGDPAEPFAPGTDLCGVLVCPPENVPDGFDEFTCGERTVNILGLYPLHAGEMKLLLDDGLDQLIERLDAAGVSDVVDPQRASVVG